MGIIVKPPTKFDVNVAARSITKEVQRSVTGAKLTPKVIIDRIAQEAARTARDPDIIERLNKMGIDALGNSPAEFAELIRADSSLWRDAVNAAGIKQE